MRLISRSYPHPVVGNADDVPEAAFQAAYEYTSDKQFYFITVTVTCSSDSLNRMIEKVTASYVLHVECGNTLYREAFDFFEKTKQIDIPASKLNGNVEVNCFIRATRPLNKYRVDGAHKDYDGAAFDLGTADILAIAEGQTFEAEPQDTLQRIGSIMVIEESPKPDDHPMEVEFSTNKIRIRLCKPDFARYKELKSIPTLASHLTTTIVLPVLIEALRLVKEDEASLEDLKWYRNLRGRLENIGMLDDDDFLKGAQMLLNMPIRRALASAAQYATDR
jgi:hypothetical protein